MFTVLRAPGLSIIINKEKITGKNETHVGRPTFIMFEVTMISCNFC